MNENIILPTEILQIIFVKLSGKDVTNCRRVCRQWKEVVDGLSDEKWREICDKDYHYVRAAYEKAKLTWRELYKSLSLWSRLESATMTMRTFPRKAMEFQLLSNGIIGVCESHSEDCAPGYSDTIVYYDVETMEEKDRENYEFKFCTYKESEQLICIVVATGKLCVIPKATKRRYILQKMAKYGASRFEEYALFGSQVFYHTTKDLLCKARLEVDEETGELIVKDYVCSKEPVCESMVSYSYVDENLIYILSNAFVRTNIYKYEDNVLDLATYINQQTPDLIYELADYGFSWLDYSVLRWLNLTFDRLSLNLTELQVTSLTQSGTTILLSTTPAVIMVYVQPYTSDGELVLFNSTPNLMINLMEILKPKQPLRKITQVDVMETGNGHSILAISTGKLHLLEFKYNF